MALEIYEKEVEDWICDNPLCLSRSRTEGTAQVIDRQVVLPHGILDILAVRNDGGSLLPEILVTELKAVPIQESDLAQVLRYVFDIYSLFSSKAMDLYFEYDYRHKSYSPRKRYSSKLMYECLGWDAKPGQFSCSIGGIIPMMVGPSEPSENLLAAAAGAGIEMYQWHKTTKGFALKEHGPEKEDVSYREYWWVDDVSQKVQSYIDEVVDYEMVHSLFSKMGCSQRIEVCHE